MPSARPVREPRLRRPGRRDEPDGPVLPPELAERVLRQGWTLSERAASGRAQGAGVVGQAWVVVDATGRQADLTLVPVPAEPRERAQVAERLGALQALDHEHVAAIAAIVEGDPGHLGVLTSRPLGTSLDLLLACRGPLSAGEAVTLAVPLAQALAALHHSGQTYGTLDRRDVTVGADGRAVLRAPLATSTASPAEDVRALAALVTGLVPPPATLHPGVRGAVGPGEGDDDEAALAALHAELAAAQRADPRGRPEAGTFAALCHEAATPLPLLLPDPARLAAAAIAEGSGSREVGAAVRAVLGDVPGRSPRVGAPPGSTARPAGAPPRPLALPVTGTGHDGARSTQGTRAAARAGAGRRAGQGGERAGPVLLASRRPVRRRRGTGSRSRGPGHPALVAALVLTVCAALAGGALAVRSWVGDVPGVRHPALAAPRTGGQDPVGTDPTRRHDDPLAAAVELTERRVEMLAGNRAMAEVVVAGSPAEQADAELLERIADAGVVVEGARAEVLDARSAVSGRPDGAGGDSSTGSPDEASIEVTYVVGAHTQRAADGTVTEVPAAEPEVAVLVLRWADGAWRVGEVG